MMCLCDYCMNIYMKKCLYKDSDSRTSYIRKNIFPILLKKYISRLPLGSETSGKVVIIKTVLHAYHVKHSYSFLNVYLLYFIFERNANQVTSLKQAHFIMHH